MNKIAYLLLVTIILVFVACNEDSKNSDAEISVPVSVNDVKKKPIEEFINTTGSVYSAKEVVIAAEMSGKYFLQKNSKSGKMFSLGDFVGEGQVVVKLEDKEYENSIKAESQRLNLEISEREYEKQKSLYDKGGVTLRELSTAEQQFINAKYSYENALLQLAKMNITSPFGGVIVELPYYTQGVKVASASKLVKIMDYSSLYMEINLPEKYIDMIKVHQEVRIMNYSLPDDTLQGNITQLSPVVDPETRTFKGVLVIENSSLQLRPGMFVRAEVVVDRKDSAIVIPKNVIQSKQRGSTIFVVRNGIAEERIIETGLENPDEIEVTNGLQENERLIVKGFETLRNRAKIKIVK